MKKLTLLLSIACFCILANAQVVLPAYQGIHQPKYKDCGIITDYDGNEYQTVVIGNQCWMKENLKVTHYYSGIAIPNIETNSAWIALDDNSTDDAYCWYNNDINNKDIYGALYTHAAATNGDNSVNNVQGACPNGWHLPNDTEWKTLEMYLGMSLSEANNTGNRGTNEGSKLAGNASLWNDGVLKEDAQFGTSNFVGIPGGYRYGPTGAFGAAPATWWSGIEISNILVFARSLVSYNTTIMRSSGYKSNGFSVRCVKNNDCGTVSDYDGNVYQTVTIGTQCWMKENLKVTHYPNGIAIPLIEDNTAWANLADNNTDDAYCYYNNNASNEADTYGALYTYAAAIGDDWVNDNNDEQGICPNGWHLPSDEEWTILADYLGGTSGAGGKMKEMGTTYWDSPNTGASNSSGFSALPGGRRTSGGGMFQYLGRDGSLWSATEGNISDSYFLYLYYGNANVNIGYNIKSRGFSVRCVKD